MKLFMRGSAFIRLRRICLNTLPNPLVFAHHSFAQKNTSTKKREFIIGTMTLQLDICILAIYRV